MPTHPTSTRGESPKSRLARWRLAAFPPGGDSCLAWVAIATLIGLLLRVWSLGDFQLTHWDEGQIYSGGQWFRSLTSEGNYHPLQAPPLVPVLLSILFFFAGESPSTAILLNVVLSTLTIPLFHLLVRDIFDSRTGAVAAVMLALSVFHAMYARLLLTESAYILVMVLVLICSVRYLLTRRWQWLPAVVLATACLQYTKYNGSLIAWPLLLILFTEPWLDRTAGRLGRSVRATGLCLLIGVPILLAIGANVLFLQLLGLFEQFVPHYTKFVGEEAPGVGELAATLFRTLPLPVPLFGFAGIALAVFEPSKPRSLLLLSMVLYVAFLLNYTFYLRLTLPIATLLLVFAAHGVATAATRLRWPRSRFPLLLGVLVAVLVVEEMNGQRTRFVDRFDGYRNAALWLDENDDTPLRLFYTQRYVWPALALPPDSYGVPTNVRNGELLAGRDEDMLFVVDVYPFSRSDLLDIRALFDRLVADGYRIAAIDNVLALETLYGAIPPGHVSGFDDDAALRSRLARIHVFRLNTRVFRELLALTSAP